MLIEPTRTRVVEYCRKLASSGLTSGTSGNISILDPSRQLVAISPSSMNYREMEPADVVVMDLEGGVVDGARGPSTEWGMHLACYRGRGDIGAVLHTHSPQATTLAVLGLDLPAVHYMIALNGRATVPCAPYRLFGTPELVEEATRHLQGGYACLLGNHGTLATGPTIAYAWALTEQIEFCAGLYLRAKAVGEPLILSEEQIAEVAGKLSCYGVGEQ
jgi:L-fuculose-phosphate aldolase